MNSIPASAVVSITPGVISAGGAALNLSGMILTTNPRIPMGTPLSFPSAIAVSNYFGPSGTEAAIAAIYFNGFTNSNVKPGALWFNQYNQAAVPGYLRGASLASMTLAQLQALSGTLVVSVGGVTKTSATINLSAATSFSNAAALIQTGFAAYDAVTNATATIAAGTATSVTGSITGYTLNVTAVSTGALVVGGVLAGTGVTAGTTITGQLTGTAGGIGTYSVSAIQTVGSGTITQTYGLMTVGSMGSGTLAVGQVISGVTITAGSTITALGTGTGQAGTYIISGGSQTVSSTTVSAGPLLASFDSIASAFVITGGTPGAAGTITFATGGLSTSLNMTSATGAVLSQGAAPATPSTGMNAVTAYSTNWGTFMTAFDPDNGYGNANKQLFAAWNSAQPSQFAYVAWDPDLTPTLSSAATSSLGYILKSNGTSGTIPIFGTDYTIAAFVCGAIASIDFTQTQGRATLAFKSQAGLVSTVTSQTVANNLMANGYNFYGAYANATNQWNYFYPGSVSGQFAWIDSYVNQIWLNSSLQTSLMTLLTSVKSVPYTGAGYALIRAACMAPINAGLNFGMYAPGVNLSTLQVAEVNAAAGANIANTLQSQGYYLQILPASAQSRGARTTPPMTLWYDDSGAVQQINLASIEVE